MKVRKVIIPAAGFGTRFLPQTKAMPKEMLPVVDKPVIQYVVEDAVSAGIEDVIIVTGTNKRAIEDHFDLPGEDLTQNLIRGNKEHLLTELESIGQLANFIYIRQKGPYGNATPVKCSKHLLNDEAFMVSFGDEFVIAEPGRAKQMIDAFDKYQAPIICCVRRESDEDAARYGFIDGEQIEDGIWKVNNIVEKPGIGNVPSSKLAGVSGYILTPGVLEIIENQKPGHGGEYVIAEALAEYNKNNPVYAVEIKNGKYYDTGNKLEYMKTIIELALKRDDMKEELSEYIKSLID